MINNYRHTDIKMGRKLRKFTIFMIIVLVLFGSGIVALHQVYKSNLQPVSSSQAISMIEVPRGATPHDIAVLLEESGVIKSGWAFEWYVRNTGAREQMKAGTYALSPNMGVEKVVEILSRGEVATNLVTILPGQRIEQIREALIDKGFTAEAVDKALDPSMYEDHPALVDKPQDANLEGYIYPETFQITAETTPEEIILAALNEMQARLTPDLRAGIVKKGLTVHEGVILASIIEKEVGSKTERNQVAQVFYKRLAEGIELGADATTRYAVNNYDSPLTFSELGSDSPYNTRKFAGLTPGPISNVTQSSLEAVASPAEGDYLFFVTGRDGVTRFSKTIDEHEALIQEYGVSAEE